MKNNFNICVTEVLKSEGGYSNDPSDSGGETNFGITQKETSIPVKTMTVDQAKTIYKKKYWDALNCDNLPSGVDYTCFDYGVNSGIERPRKALQRFKSQGVSTLIDSINNERTAFLEALATQRTKDKKFLKGWLARVERVRKYSHYLSSLKDNTSGPAAGIIVGTTLWTTLSQYIKHHESLVIIGSCVIAFIIGAAIHLYRNKND